MQTLLNIWASRGLTLLGKITVLKSLVIPKIVYKATYLSVTLPEIFIKELNRIMHKFIWGSKREKIGRSQLCYDVEKGGDKMIASMSMYFLLGLTSFLNYLITITNPVGNL